MSQRQGGDDGPRPPGDGDLPELPPEWGRLTVPDDPRELAAEAETVRAELWAEANAGQQPGFVARRRLRSGLSGPLVGLVLMLIAAVGSLTIVALPYAPSRPVRAPLTTTTVADGQRDGLLPDIRLPDDNGRAVTLRDIRPAVLLLMPAGCQCDGVAASLVGVSADAQIPVGLVGAAQAPARPSASSRDRVIVLTDPAGGLSGAITAGRTAAARMGPIAAPTGPTAVLVRSDGLIAAIVPDLRDAAQIRADLAALTVR